jgi:hypothetical protein
VNIHPTSYEGLTCPCGAVISEDEHSGLCAKCRSRVRWNRRTVGRRRQQRAEARRNGGRS